MPSNSLAQFARVDPGRRNMVAVAVIPARGGSKGVPGKNLRRVGGVPLVVRAVQYALDTPGIEAVVVSTDDEQIADCASRAGAVVVARPSSIAGDLATSESALLHAMDEFLKRPAQSVPDVLVFLQATSPFQDTEALSRAIARVHSGAYDCVFSATETFEFIWADESGTAVPINHQMDARLRRQDREPHYRETGAFYVVGWRGFQRARHRFYGTVGIEVVDPVTAIEIDTVAELDVARRLSDIAPPLSSDLSTVTGLVMDFDGVHTDDYVYISQSGEESVRASRADGLGISRLREIGLPMLILSKETNPVVTARAQKLKVEVEQAVDDKAAALRKWAERHAIDPRAIVYVGNDVNDLPAMSEVGWPVAVSGAHPLVRQSARLVLEAFGGSGAIREIADKIISHRKERL